jgi:hypothetical protein
MKTKQKGQKQQRIWLRTGAEGIGKYDICCVRYTFSAVPLFFLIDCIHSVSSLRCAPLKHTCATTGIKDT